MLRFYYGVMGSSKTAMLLIQRHNYIKLGYPVALLKPAIDTRVSPGTVYSRVGLTANADIVLERNESVLEALAWLAMRNGRSEFPVVFVDEAQFLSSAQIQDLADYALTHEVFCYGLKTDFQGLFFEGSSALFRLAEELTEIPGALCWCGCKATMNARIDHEGTVLKTGEQVQIESQADVSYVGLCYKHWKAGKSHA